MPTITAPPRGGGGRFGAAHDADHREPLPGQDVLTVASTQAKIEAQIRCMGCGYIPEPMARPHIEAGRLVVKEVDQRPLAAWATPGARAPAGAGRSRSAWRCSGG